MTPHEPILNAQIQGSNTTAFNTQQKTRFEAVGIFILNNATLKIHCTGTKDLALRHMPGLALNAFSIGQASTVRQKQLV